MEEEEFEGRLKQFKEAKVRIYSLINRMSERIGIEIPRDQYPSLRLEKDVLEYRPNLNEFAIDPVYSNSGEVIGEEITHFIRDYARKTEAKKPLPKLLYYLRHPFGNELDRVPSNKTKKEVHTDEFFGYLGRRILQEIARKDDNLRFGEKIKPPKEYTRKERLEHIRPYRFAQALDLSRITDYKRLFSLPDKKVRSRFFRADPQYDLNKPIEKARITPKEHRLEDLVKIISLPFLILALFLITKSSMTGNSIKSLEPINSIKILVILIISLVFFIAIGIKKTFK